MTSLVAIVPATDRPETLGRCLRAIREAHDAPEEVVVVDEPAGLGPAGARNLGVQQSKADVLVFIDSDVVVRADAFSRIRAAFERDPALVALFGTYDDYPEAPGAVSGFRNLLHHHVHSSSGGPAETFWAGLGAVRRAEFVAAGGFDDARYPQPSIEDVELGMRLAASGASIRLDPGLQGTHLKAWTLRTMLRTDVAARGSPWVQLMLRRRAAGESLNLGWRHRLSALACLVGAGALVARRPALAGLAAVALVGLNRSFYTLLLERRGPGEAVAGVGLHALHHLAGIASVPIGTLAYLSDRSEPRRDGSGR